MSTAASGVGILGIAALPAAVLGLCAYGAYKAFELLKKADKKVLDKLEKNRQELANQSVLTTPNGLTSKFTKDLLSFKEVIKPFKLSPEEELSFANTYALETSGLGKFLTADKINEISQQGKISEKDCLKLVSEAVKNFKVTSLEYTKKAIAEVAKEIGFGNKLSVRKTLLGTHITATNKLGQSIVVLTDSTDNGMKINADTTGFKNGECTKVMDAFIKKLADRHIQISNLKIKEHWKEEGILNKYTELKEKEISNPANEQQFQSRESKKFSFRRKLNSYFNKQKTKI
jgi:hypothetical protein